jgi:signal transduction histidine kinase
MHAGKLSNICLEIRRYEKNFIIGQDQEDFIKALEYIREAQEAVPEVIGELKIMSPSSHLQDLSTNLASYKRHFLIFKKECSPGMTISECPSRDALQTLGQELVTITENLVAFEQQKMNAFIEKFRSRLLKTIVFLIVLSIFIISIIYKAIIIPLKSVEKAAIKVANGTFTLLPVDTKKGEVRSVLRAFNQMVQELEEKQEQLFQAKKLSSIGTLASGTAHQINNPLNNIATSCQLALDSIDAQQNPFVAKMLETINQETQRAGEIVRSLLEFSRVQTFSLQPRKLAEIVAKVTQLVASEIPAGVSLKTDIPDEIIIFVDVQKFVEALLNLTINAIQAIPEPPGTVSIQAKIDADNTNVIITVADTGIGIDKENLQKIFDPFFTTKKAGNGTGLGLSVVYGIIKKQHGLIRVESEKGKGSNFIITLPLYVENEEIHSLGNNDLSGNENV